MSHSVNHKVDRLTTIPAEFLSKIPASESQVYDQVVLLLAKLDIKNGSFAINKKNVQIVSSIFDLLRGILLQSDYSKYVAEFVKEFDNQAVISNDIFKAMFPEFTVPDLATQINNIAKRQTVDLLLNRAADLDFVSPLRSIIEQAVYNGAGYKETLTNIRTFIKGEEKELGALSKYSSTYARDSFAVTDRTYTAIVSKDLKAEWFLYTGGTIATSRPFCKERDGEYFHIREIEGWFDKPSKLQPGQHTPVNGKWTGMVEGTNINTFFSYCGGWNCAHVPLPQSIFAIPISVVKRAIDAGYYKPSKFEREELGL